MKKILLTQGKFALVDDADYEWLNQWKWYADKSRNTYYVKRTSSDGHTIRMHRQILGLLPGVEESDHQNGNGLDNRRCNLRFCTTAQNQHNQQLRQGCTSQFKGISWRKEIGKWIAQISKGKKRIWIGSFDDETEAAKAYDKKAVTMRGKYAQTNF